MGLAGMIEARGVELYELHVLHRSLGAVDHCLAVAGGDNRVCGCLVDGTAAAGTHQRDLAQIGVDLPAGVQHVSTVTFDVGCAPCDLHAEVVLGDNLHSEVVLLDDDVGVGTHGSHQCTLDLGTGVVGMVEDAELGVTALTVQVVAAVAASCRSLYPS